MHKRHYISSLLIVLFVLVAITSSVVAQDDTRFSHSIRYDIEGLIDIYREVGHACFTGAVKKQTILGYGELTKTEDVRIAQHIMTNQETTDWSVPADALGNLTVTTIIELCARPMSVAAANYSFDPVNFVYGLFDIKAGDIISPYDPIVVDGRLAVLGKTKQIWATHLVTTQGQQGSYHVDFTAAYGPGPRQVGGVELDSGEIIFYDREYMWWFDQSKEDGIGRGKYYVGNYFNIEQFAYTSGGQLRRFISMSSPFLNSYYIEELDVTGSAEVDETFSMMNLERGPKGITLAWYELF